MPGDWLQPVPLNEAPIGSLNGLVMEGPDAPTGLIKLTKVLDLLSAGGVAILLYQRRVWKRGELHEICRGGGFHLRADRPARRFLGFGRGQLVVLQKQDLPETTLPDKVTSIVIPYTGGPFAPVRAQVLTWAHWLIAQGWKDRSQIVLVNDGHMSNEDMTIERASHGGLLDIVHHYRPFGPGACVRTGILHCVGRRVVVDESGGSVPPQEYQPLLSGLLRAEKNAGARGGTAQNGYVPEETSFRTMADRSLRSARSRRFSTALRFRLNRLLTGIREPFGMVRLYAASLAREIARSTHENGIYHRLESTLFLKRTGRALEEVPIDPSNTAAPDNKFGPKAPGALGILRYRLHLRSRG